MGRSLSARPTGVQSKRHFDAIGGDDNMSAVRVVVLQAAQAGLVGQVEGLTRQRDQYKAERDQYSAQLDQSRTQLVCPSRGVCFLQLSRPASATKGRIRLVLLTAF